jgi:hypothetical protein
MSSRYDILLGRPPRPTPARTGAKKLLGMCSHCKGTGIDPREDQGYTTMCVWCSGSGSSDEPSPQPQRKKTARDYSPAEREALRNQAHNLYRGGLISMDTYLAMLDLKERTET